MNSMPPALLPCPEPPTATTNYHDFSLPFSSPGQSLSLMVSSRLLTFLGVLVPSLVLTSCGFISAPALSSKLRRHHVQELRPVSANSRPCVLRVVQPNCSLLLPSSWLNSRMLDVGPGKLACRPNPKSKILVLPCCPACVLALSAAECGARTLQQEISTIRTLMHH